MTDNQAVAIIAAILYAGTSIERQLSEIEKALTHDTWEYSGLSFDEAVARARDLLELAQTPTRAGA